jgi:hypothetical protein
MNGSVNYSIYGIRIKEHEIPNEIKNIFDLAEENNLICEQDSTNTNYYYIGEDFDNMKEEETLEEFKQKIETKFKALKLDVCSLEIHGFRT